MNNNEEFKTPSGYIGMVLHKGGEYNPETGKVEGGEILEREEFKNLIVDSASKLMAMRMAPGARPNDNTGTAIGDGLQFLAVGTGTGAPSFDYMNPQPAETSDTKLRQEIFRKEFTTWCYVDPGTGADITDPNNATNIIKVATTFYENEAVGALVEMGLFGGQATSDKDSGIMFNYKTFPVWNKPSDARLTINYVVA